MKLKLIFTVFVITMVVTWIRVSVNHRNTGGRLVAAEELGMQERAKQLTYNYAANKARRYAALNKVTTVVVKMDFRGTEFFNARVKGTDTYNPKDVVKEFVP